MIRLPSVVALELHIVEKVGINGVTPSLVLIGGCARAGKSTVAETLCSGLRGKGIESEVVPLDSWLISIESRPAHSTVLERYECRRIVESIRRILEGEAVSLPVYDPILRRRIAEAGGITIQANRGVVFVEGVIGLALPELSDWAALRVFVALDDETRLERLRSFYHETKCLSIHVTQEIIDARETEEVPFIKKTAQNADVIIGDGV